MRASGVHFVKYSSMIAGVILALAATTRPCPALDKPTGAPLELSPTETEQPVPLAFLDPDGKIAHCAEVKLHWNPNPDVGPDDEATSFTIDLPPENPGAAIFTAQLWSASLASALAWQQPWQGARWKIIQTPVTDGTGIDAALAVGMIATSARRPYPEKTLVIGSLNPDGSLGPVSHLIDRMNAAAAAGITRIIIPSVQAFDTDATGQVINLVRHAGDLHVECVPVDNLVEATETVMNDPLPDVSPGSSTPHYNSEVVSYVDDFAHREEGETELNLKFAPKEADLVKYPYGMATIWRSIYADIAGGQQAYRAGQVYVAYRLLSQANASMVAANQLAIQNRASFDVKAALADSDDLRNHLHALMSPPVIDKGELQSAVLVAEMADWAYDIDASLEGAQLVTKQTFSQRSDATDAEKERARVAILFAIEQAKYLLNQSNFYEGLLAHLGKDNSIPVDENAAHLLPQLIPAQLATARIFIDGIRQRANDLRDGLLFDPRLVAYVNVLRDVKADWDARQRKKEMEQQPDAPTTTPGTTDGGPVKPNSNAGTGAVAFDPGNTYAPPHVVVAPTVPARKLSDAALCLIWVNHDCEIATLDEKYLRLSGTVDPVTHEWHVKDRARLDALLQSAEAGARLGIAFAEKAEVDSSVLSLIYERASYLRIQSDDAAALDALRHYWRCALLGNMCWQLAHTHKAQPVDLSTASPDNGSHKPAKGEGTKGTDKPVVKADDTPKETSATKAAADAATAKLLAETNHQTPSPATTNDDANVNPPTPLPPVVPIAPHEAETPAPPRALPVVEATQDNPAPTPPPAPTPKPPPRALPVIEDTDVNPTPPPAPKPPTPPPAAPTVTASQPDDANIPVAPIARTQDYVDGQTSATTNAAPVVGPLPPSNGRSDNADGHGFP